MASHAARTASTLLSSLLAILLAAPRAALAQGTSGTLPDPISSRELSRYAGVLGLSDEQRLAAELFHDEYRHAFRELRDSEIEAFLRQSGSLRPSMRMIMDRAAVRESMRELERLMGRIRTLDNGLFDGLQALLTEDQLARMSRVRKARERIRHQAGLTRFASFANPAANLDVSEIVLELRPAPEVLAAIEPVLVQYESQLTSGVKRLHDGTIELTEDLFKRLDAAGFDEAALGDRARGAQLFESFQRIWSELASGLVADSAALSDLNRRTVDQLESLLPPDLARELRDRYYTEAYKEIHSAPGDNPARRPIEIASGMEDLSEEQRQAIAGLSASFFAETDRITGHSADLVDENRRTRTMLFGPPGEGQAAFGQAMLEQAERRRSANDRAIAQLLGLLGPTQVEALEGRVAIRDENEHDETGTAIAAAPAPPPVPAGGAMRLEPPPGGPPEAFADPFLPVPITQRDLDRYGRRLSLNEAEHEVLATMHADYLEAFDEVDRTKLTAVREAQQKLWKLDSQEGRMAAPSEEDVARVYVLRRAALAAVQALDASFFGDFVSVLGGDRSAAMERISLSRQRELFARGLQSGGAAGMGRAGRMASMFSGRPLDEAGVDVSRVVADLDLSDEEARSINEALLEYERTATGVFRSAFDACLDLQEATEKLGAAGAAQAFAGGGGGRVPPPQRGGGQGGPPGGGGWGSGFRELFEGQGRVFRQAQRTIVDTNRAALARLQGSLSPQRMAEIRDAYNRQAYPDIFDDPRSPSRKIVAALAMDDLTPQQRAELGEVSAAFHGSYDELCQRLVALRSEGAAGDAAPAGERPRWEGRLEQQRGLERVRAERDDLNHKTLLRLRALLSGEQAERLGLAELE